MVRNYAVSRSVQLLTGVAPSCPFGIILDSA
jgi:hypothetical protein